MASLLKQKVSFYHDKKQENSQKITRNKLIYNIKIKKIKKKSNLNFLLY